MRLLRHIMTVVSLLLLAVSCGEKKDKVIPRGKLAEIYAEFLVMDQWVSSNSNLRRMADTTLVYEPILERYGYTSADYRKSVDVYMNDPERFSRILRTTGTILDKRLKDLERCRTEMEHEEELRKQMEARRIVVTIDMGEYFPYLHSEPYVHYYDSLTVETDSLLIYRLRNIDRADTIYRDLRMVILDSLQVADTLMVKDSIAR